MTSKIDELLKKANLPVEKLIGSLILSLKSNAVIHAEGVDNPVDKASMCLGLLTASTSLTQSFDDEPVKLLRVRTDPHEYFIVCDDAYLLLAIVAR